MDNIGQNKDQNDLKENLVIKDNNLGLQKKVLPKNKVVFDFGYIYKKTEKIATALYMITNLFADSEPMKWTLRGKISHLLSFIISFKNAVHFRNEEFKSEMRLFILEIISLFEISYNSGLVSQMNFRILKAEFLNLINAVSQFEKNDTGKGFDLNNDFFEVKDSILNSGSNATTDGDFSIWKKDKTEDAKTSHVPKKTNRQNIIVNLLKKKGNLGIKDIALFVKDCSEKTIQRELTSLVKIGLLRKDGERRWSRYSLVNGI